MKLRIGTKLQLSPYVLTDSRYTEQKKITGTVVYINKPHRFFTAEFVLPYGTFRESFKFHYKSDLLHKPKQASERAFRTCRWMTF